MSPLMLGGIVFGRVWNASGARNFYGDGYAFHKLWRHLGLNYTGSTFVAKTTTWESRTGHLALIKGTALAEWRPKCIKVNFRKGAVLNAVGLSGPGVAALLDSNQWQTRLDPFFLSFMAVQADLGDRLAAASQFAHALWARNMDVASRVGIQVNLSCPNVGTQTHDLVDEARRVLQVFRWRLPATPLAVKLSAVTPIAVARAIADLDDCAALVVSNTIPWGRLPERIDWKGLFGEVSPLAQFGGGGLSGAPLLPIVRDWVAEASAGGFPKPIIAGGGVLSCRDAGVLLGAGASAIELGTVAILRPWRVQGIIRYINRDFE